jgi:hypothetical protein
MPTCRSTSRDCSTNPDGPGIRAPVLELEVGVAGMVYFLEPRVAGGRGGAGGGSTLHRYSLRDRREHSS